MMENVFNEILPSTSERDRIERRENPNRKCILVHNWNEINEP